MSRSAVQAVTLAVALAGLNGCAGIAKPERTGFISDYAGLEQVDDHTLFYSSGRLGDYEKFIIEPVALLFEPDDEDVPFSGEELTELEAYFADALAEELSEDDGYAIVTTPGPAVARIRFGLTDVKRTIGLLNISLVTKLSGAGIGGASAEGEILDSVSGEQLAATVRWGGGSRVLRAGITKAGDAKIAMRRWSRDLREVIDEAHGR